MKIEFETNDLNNAVWDMLEGFFIFMLKKQIENDTNDYNPEKGWVHEGDIKEAKKRIKACKTILQYYEV